MARPLRRPEAPPIPPGIHTSPGIPMPPLGPRETIVWEEMNSPDALRAALPCLIVLHHRARPQRPLYICHVGAAASEVWATPVLPGLMLRALRVIGVRCYIAHLTPLQFENCKGITRYLVGKRARFVGDAGVVHNPDRPGAAGGARR